MEPKEVKAFFASRKVCLLLPTYNNAGTLDQVIKDCIPYLDTIFLVNDGSTDDTLSIVNKYPSLNLITYDKNKGKGYALQTGLQHALDAGFHYCITMDTDGQHFANDLPSFAKAIKVDDQKLYIGARNLREENMPKKNTFGNKFSNFWVKLQTGYDLPDTQSGFRSYPIKRMGERKYYCAKYEFELEVMVRSAWKNIPLAPIPIKVHYEEGDKRISHFRPFWDFVRITFLNIILTTLAFIWFIPKRFFQNLSWKRIKDYLNKELINTKDSTNKIGISVGFGVFMGIIPIWGYQFAAALILAHYLKLNKVIVGLAANISIPPMIPFILYGSLITGQYFLGHEITSKPMDAFNSLSNVKNSIFEYVVGSIALAILAGLIIGLITWVLVFIKRGFRK